MFLVQFMVLMLLILIGIRITNLIFQGKGLLAPFFIYPFIRIDDLNLKNESMSIFSD